MTARVLISILYKNRRGQHVCEVHDKREGKFLSVGIGQTAKLAESRAYTAPQVKYTPYQTAGSQPI